MSIKLIVGIFLFFFIGSATAIDWQKILRDEKFVETRSKGLLPYKVLKAVGIEKYTEIANPGEDWNCCCDRTESLPDVQLNWAAYDAHGNWIVSYYRGGFITINTVKLIPAKKESNTTENEAITSFQRLPADSSFAAFRKNYLEN